MQVYLPDDLYDLVKKRRLPASELLQKASRSDPAPWRPPRPVR